MFTAMKKSILLPLVCLCMATTALPSAKAAKATSWRAEATIEFDATSTLHDFTGTVQTVPFVVQIQQEGPLATVDGTATVAAASMNTQHVKRDRNMHKMFKADSFPILTGVVKAAQIDPEQLTSVPLELTVLGKTHRVPLTLTDWEMKEERIRVEGSLSLSLKELGLKPPVILGFIRVGDAVTVRIHIHLFALHPPDIE